MSATKPVAARWATFTIFFANGVGFGMWATAIPPLKIALGISPAELSLALLAGTVGAVAMMQAAGRLTAYLGGTGRTTRLSAFAYALVLALPTLAPNLPVLVLVAVAMGATGGLMDVSMNAHAAFVEQRWGAAIMSSFHAGFSVGGLVGAGFGAVLIALGMPTPWLMLPAAVLVLGMLWLAVPHLGTGDETAAPAEFRLPERRLLGLALIGLFCFFIEGAMADWGGLYLIAIGATPATAAAAFASFSLTMVAGRLIGDAVVRRIGGGITIMAGTLTASAGLALAVAWPVIPAVVCGLALVGIGLANVVPVVFSASARLGSSAAHGIAAVSTAGYGGMLAGPPLIGAVASHWSLRIGFVVLATSAFIAACIAALSHRRAVSPAADA